MNRRPRTYSRRGSVILIVLWSIAIATLVAAGVQLISYRQAVLSREITDQAQARWSARAGIEATINIMANDTEQPIPEDAYSLTRELEYVADGEINGVAWQIRHFKDGQVWRGPMDEHSRHNINRADSANMLMFFENMTFDVAAAVTDWIDEDDEPSELGVERDYYLSLDPPYEPANGPVRTLGEVELIAGIWPEYFRGEDWNLNNNLDPNENDGSITLPEDDADGELDWGWAARLTPYSVDGGVSASGLPRIQLGLTTPDELMERLGISEAQAHSLIEFGSTPSNRVENLITQALGDEGVQNTQGEEVNVNSLTDEQLRLVLQETVVQPPYERTPGRMNINTASEDLLREMYIDDVYMADQLLYMRNTPEGITSMLDLFDIPDMDAAQVQQLAGVFDTVSNVFTITSRGRTPSGMEVEIIAVVDRSTVPVKIIEYREQ